MGEADKGLFFALVGPGGAGKSTLLKAALGQINNLRQLPTATTRAPRSGEAHGRERYFLSNDEFIARIRANGFYEYEEVHPGKFYGTPRADIDSALRAGQDLIADIDAKGACFLRVALPENLRLVFVAPPDQLALRARLEGRGDDAEATRARLDRFQWEMAFADVCDEQIVNRDIASAVVSLREIIEAARAGHRRCPPVPCFARLLPLRQGQLYLRANPVAAPQAALRAGELPHETAMRAVSEHFGWRPCAEQLCAGQPAAREFIPILHVLPSPREIFFYYPLFLPPEARIPADYHAHPITEAPITRETRAALLNRLSALAAV